MPLLEIRTFLRALFATVFLISFSSFIRADNLTYTDTPPNQQTSYLSGTLSSVGSDTLSGLMTRWAQQFERTHPQIHIQVQASGSSSAPTALIQGTTQLGAMSRPMTNKELDAFKKKYHYFPTQLTVALDAVGIFVHKNNPIEGLNLQQVDALFSSTLTCLNSSSNTHASQTALTQWQQLGVSAPWAKLNIQLFGRTPVSGTYVYVKQRALCGGDFKAKVNEELGAASVLESVANSINSIGYSGFSDKHSNTRLLPIAEMGTNYIQPNAENILNNTYPLTRELYIYINKAPNKPLSNIEMEWLKFIYSDKGQSAVKAEGYVPLLEEQAQRELTKING